MDRLSSYAARESESEPQDDRKKTEEEATSRLLEKLKISKEPKEAPTKQEKPESNAPNGDQTNGDSSISNPADASESETTPVSELPAVEESSEDAPLKKNRGIPENVKLYEIFYEQVTNLVNAQRLHIHDTIALLVSLSNLALYVSSVNFTSRKVANILCSNIYPDQLGKAHAVYVLQWLIIKQSM